MQGEKRWCPNCGKLVAVLLIGAVGAEVLEHHECSDVGTDAECRKRDDTDSRDPHRPAPLGNQATVTFTTSTSTSGAPILFTIPASPKR
jgi:hypothetical protein